MPDKNWFTPEMAEQLRATDMGFQRIVREVNLPVLRPENTAEAICDRFHELFTAFEKSLNPDEDIAIALASFGVARQIVVTAITSMGPALIVIKGFEDGAKVVLVQHLSQMSFLLVPVKRKDPDEPRRKIGFGEPL